MGAGPRPDEDALLAQHPEQRPGCPTASALSSLSSLVGQLGGVGVVDGDPHRRAPASAGSGAAGAGARAGAGLRRGRPATWASTSASSRPPSTSAPRSGALRAGGRAGARSGAPGPRCRATPGTCGGGEDPGGSGGAGRGRAPRATTWKLVPPKPKALTPPRRTPPARLGPVAQLGVDARTGRCPSRRSGWGRTKFRLGGEHLSCSERDHLEQPGGAGGGLEVADVGLHRAEGDGAGRGTGGAEDGGEAAQLRGVADPGGGAVRLDRRRRWRGRARRASQARSTASCWPTGLGAVMPLPLPSEEPPMPRITA